jgi:hypothetical protein
MMDNPKEITEEFHLIATIFANALAHVRTERSSMKIRHV